MFRALAAGVIVTLSLTACHQSTPQEEARQKIQECAAQAGEYLDPHWTPRQVTGVYPTDNGVDAVITAQGTRAKVTCGVGSGYYIHYISGVSTIEGVEPVPGQLYLPGQHRWLTPDELRARLTSLLAPRFGEYAGVAWAPNPPGVSTISDPVGVPATNCFAATSRRDSTRELVACQVPAGHRYWVSQGQMILELRTPPPWLRPIPPAPPANPSTQPGGAVPQSGEAS